MKKKIILIISLIVLFAILCIVFVKPPKSKLPDAQEKYAILKSELKNTKALTMSLKDMQGLDENNKQNYTKIITDENYIKQILDIFDRAEVVLEKEGDDILDGDLKKLMVYKMEFALEEDESIATFNLSKFISIKGTDYYLKFSQLNVYDELLKLIESELKVLFFDDKYWDYECLESQLGAYITSESDIPNQISLKELVDVVLDDDSYYQVKRNQKKDIYVIINTKVKNTIVKVDQYFDTNYSGYKAVFLEDDLKVYVYNRSNDFDLENDLQICYK